MSQKFKVLILDDDESFSSSLSESLQAYNYESLVCSSVFDAEDELKTYAPNLLIVDLFMPSGNGSDWVNSLLSKIDFQIPVVYVSGIVTDIDFQNSLYSHPLILKVFSKPFEIASLIGVIERWENSRASMKKEGAKVSELSGADQVLIGSNYEGLPFLSNLSKPISFSSMNLPQYLNYFFNSKSRGKVKLVQESNKIEIHFDEGSITFVEVDDPRTSFGVLLAKLTNLTYAEIEKYCNQARSANQRIGHFLLENKIISDLEIFKVVNLQIALRLLQLFNKKVVSCEWSGAENSTVKKVGYFSKSEWRKILVRFSNNLENKWLEDFSKKFNSYYLILREENLPEEIKNKELLANFSSLQQRLSSNHVRFVDFNLLTGIQKIRSIYLFLLLDVLALSDFKQLSKKELLVIYNENKNKNYFELLNVDMDSTDLNIKQEYRQLSKQFHPDNCGFSASQEEKSLYTEIFNSISEAYTTLSKSEMRESYSSLLDQEQFESQFKGQLLENEIIAQLQDRNLLNIFKKINNSNIVYGKKQVFLLWSLTIAYVNESAAIKKQSIKIKMAVYIKNIPENIGQFNHFIYLAKALYYEAMNNFKEAKYYFNKIQNIEAVDVEKHVENIEALLLQQKKKSIKIRDIKFAVVLSVLVLSVFGYKFVETSLVPSYETPIVVSDSLSSSSPVFFQKQKKRRVLSSIEKKIKVEKYFSHIKGFHVSSTEEGPVYKLVRLQNYSFISKVDSSQSKLAVLIYRQLVPSNKVLVTEKNFLKKQGSLLAVHNLLKSQVNLKKQTSTIWYGNLLDEVKTTLTVQYIAKYNSFLYFVGNFDNIPNIRKHVLTGLAQL